MTAGRAQVIDTPLPAVKDRWSMQRGCKSKCHHSLELTKRQIADLMATT